MSRKFHNKLVRDKIPEIVLNSGSTPQCERMNDKDFALALKEKLIEEAQEVQSAEGDSLQVELADLLEVIDALMTHHGISREEVITLQQQRRLQRGAFEQQIKLRWVESPTS